MSKENFSKRLADFHTKIETYAMNNFNTSESNEISEGDMSKEISDKAKELKLSLAEMKDMFNVLKPLFAKNKDDDKEKTEDKFDGKGIHPEQKEEEKKEEDEEEKSDKKHKTKKYLKKIITEKDEAYAALEDDLKNGFINDEEYKKVSNIIDIAEVDEVGEIFGDYANTIESRTLGNEEVKLSNVVDKNILRQAREDKMDNKKLAERKEARMRIINAGFQSEGVDSVSPSSYEQHDWNGKDIKEVEKDGIASIDGYADTASATQQKIEKEHGVYRQGDDRYRTASSFDKIVRLASDDAKFIETEKTLDKLAEALDESLSVLTEASNDEAILASFGDKFNTIYDDVKQAVTGAREGVAVMGRARMEEDSEIRTAALESADNFIKAASVVLDELDSMFIESRKSQRMNVLASIQEDEKIAERAEFDTFIDTVKTAKSEISFILKRASAAKAKAFEEKKKLHGLRLAGTNVNKDDLELTADAINQLNDIEIKANSIKQSLDNAEVRLDIKAMDDENLKSAMSELDEVVKEANGSIDGLTESLDIIEKEPTERLAIRKDATWRTKIATYQNGLDKLRTKVAETLTDMKHLFTIINESKPLYSERRQENLNQHQEQLRTLASSLITLDDELSEVVVNINDEGIKTASIESRGEIIGQIDKMAGSILDKIAETKSEMDSILQYSEGIATTLDTLAEADVEAEDEATDLEVEAGSMPAAAMEALKKYRSGKGGAKKDDKKDKDDDKDDEDKDDEDKDDKKKDKDEEKDEDDDDSKEKKEAGSIPQGLKDYQDKQKGKGKDKDEDEDEDDKKKDKEKEDEEDDDDDKKEKKEAGSIPPGLKAYQDKQKGKGKDKKEEDDEEDEEHEKKESKEFEAGEEEEKKEMKEKKDKKKKKALCGECGFVVLAEDRFCESCGAKFEGEAEGGEVEGEACGSDMEAAIDADRCDGVEDKERDGIEDREECEEEGGDEGGVEAAFASMKDEDKEGDDKEEEEEEEEEKKDKKKDSEEEVEGEEEAMCACGSCKTSLSKKAHFCSNCGTQIKLAAKKADKKEDKKKDKKEDKKCPKCKKDPCECDKKKEKKEKEVEAAYACGNCNKIVAVSASECQHCGAVFQTKTAGVDKQLNFTSDIMTEQEKYDLTEETITKLPTDVRDVVAKIVEERNQLKAKFAVEQKRASEQMRKSAVTDVINAMVEKGMIASDNREAQKAKAKELLAMNEEAFGQLSAVINDAPIQRRASSSKGFERTASDEVGLTMPLILETTQEEMTKSGLDFLNDEWTTPAKKAGMDFSDLVKKAQSIKDYDMFS